jgi:hypothetical protein
MPRYRHVLGWGLAGAGVVLGLLVIGVLLLTRTEAGVERAGQYVVERLRGSITGELEVARVRSRGLLRGVTLDGVKITGPDGRLFLQADSARLTYDIRTLLGGDISFNRLALFRPEVHLERLPGVEKWNFQILFPDDGDETDGTVENLVLIEDATIRDGYVAVRIPWDPAGPVSPEDTARLILEEVPGGLVRTVRFTELNGRLPQILWQAPEAEGRVVRIGQLSGHAYIWDAPAIIRDLRATVTVRDSIVAFRATHVRLADSELAAFGRMVLGDEYRHYDIQAEGDRLAFRDFQWLYPSLPDDGGGALRFRMQTQERDNVLWLIEDARIRTMGSDVSGSFGVVTGDTLYFANVNLRASPLDMDLVRRLLPVDLPVEGLLIGTVEVDGPLSSLRTRGDLRHRDVAHGGVESAVRWTGVVRARPSLGVSGLDAEIRRLDLSHVAALVPELRVRGVGSGRVRVDGTVERGFQVTGRLALDQGGSRSTIHGGGSFLAANGRSSVDMRIDADPVALSLLSQQYPALHRVAGHASGPIRLAGSLTSLQVGADLRAPGGELHLDGRFEVTDAGARYVTEGSITDLRLDRLVDGIPATSLTGRFELEGGFGPVERMSGRVRLDLSSGEVAGVEIQGGRLRGSIHDGVATVDTLRLVGPMGRVAAAGTVGLAPGTEGRLEVTLAAETLAPLAHRLLPRTAGEETLSGPRVDGMLQAAATVTGSRGRWQAEARVTGRNLVYDRVSLGTGLARLGWDGEHLLAEVRGDSLIAMGRRVPRVSSSLEYTRGAGHVALDADGDGGERLGVDGRFQVGGGQIRLELASMDLATADAQWSLDTPTAARAGPDGVEIRGLVLRRRPGDAEIRVGGVIPWRTDAVGDSPTATLVVDLRAIPLAEVARLGQVDRDVDGVLGAMLRLTGSALDPVLAGTVYALPFRYETAVLDSVGGWVGYQERLLSGSLVGWRDGRAIVAADATIPVDLALTDREGRLLARPMHAGVRADGMPAGLLTFLLPGLRQVEGVVHGSMRLGGLATSLGSNGTRPALEGELSLADGSAFVEPLNVRFHDMVATARMGDGSTVHVDARLRSEHGAAQVRGTMDLSRPSDPEFDLELTGRRLDAVRRRDVTALADGEVRLGGRYTRPVVGGNVRLISGELNLDEVLRQYQIVQLDTSLFQIFDAASIPYAIRPANPFIENVTLVGLTLTADRNFWIRSSELNIEVEGSLDVALDRQARDIRLSGTMAATRGTYQLQVLERVPTRRFEIRDGTIEFPGTPGIDPNLAITASHRVRRAQGDPLDVVATVTGTLQSPRVRLSSDSDPPVSETDIASFLLFGRSTLELSQAESDVVASMREGMLGLARPIFLGLASTQLQQAAANLGLPVDHLALTAPEYGFGDYSQVMSVHGGLGVLQGTQLEAGAYLHRDIFVLGSFSPFARAMGAFAEAEPLFQPRWGARVEWRFRPTWTAELYWEDRFARTPSFSYDQIHDRTVGGLSVFREWGY